MQIVLVLALLLLVGCHKSSDAASVAKPSLLDAGVSSSLARGETARFEADAGASARAALTQPSDGGPPLEFTGVLRGVVKLAKGEKLPLAPFPLQNGLVPPSVKPCPPVDASDQRTVVLAKQTGGLSPVHVALTGMTGVPTRAPVTHDLFIDACRMRPAMLAGMRGDKVRITNRSEMALVPRMPSTSFMRGLMRGESAEGELKQTRSTIDCSFGSYCGEALAIATKHPLYAVTSTEGFFTIEQVPLDQDLKVFAWNPLFEVTSASFRLTHAQPEQMVELTLTPTALAKSIKPGAPPPPPPPKVIVKKVDGGIIVDTPGPAYE